MKVVTLQLASLDDVKRRAQDAFKGGKQSVRISFASPELLFMTVKRWELALLNAGILRKTENGRIVFPFDAIQVDVMLRAA